MPGEDSTYDPGTPEQREYARQVADQERQQKRLLQAAAESRKLAEGLGQGVPAAKLSPTAIALQWSWRFYIPSFTLTSIYIFLHMLLRYVFHFHFFCRADQGSPLAGAGGDAAGKALSGVAGQKPPVGGGVMEKVWLALGVASVVPLAIAVGVIVALANVLENPWRYKSCTLKYVALETITITIYDGDSSFMKCVLSRKFQ